MSRTESGAYLYSTGGARWYGNRMWSHAWYVRNCLCQDGKRRTVRLNQSADTYFSWSGRASIGGRTVRGAIFTPFDSDEPIFHVFGS